MVETTVNSNMCYTHKSGYIFCDEIQRCLRLIKGCLPKILFRSLKATKSGVDFAYEMGGDARRLA